jgi:hypothetical protein
MLHVDLQSATIETTTSLSDDKSRSGRIDVKIESRSVLTNVVTEVGTITIAMGSAATGGTTNPTSLISADSGNIIKLGTDSKLFAQSNENPQSIQSWVDAFNSNLT